MNETQIIAMALAESVVERHRLTVENETLKAEIARLQRIQNVTVLERVETPGPEGVF